MIEKNKNDNSLSAPPVAINNPDAIEVIRVWAVPGNLQEVSLKTFWQDPGAWGIMLVDIAKHVAQAYSNEGHNKNVVLKRIKELFDAEWSSPTYEPNDITQNN